MDLGVPKLMLIPLSVMDTDDQPEIVTLPIHGQLLIGRSADADWPLFDPSISRRHASVLRKGEHWLLTDLSSRHGTQINNSRIEPGRPIPIQDGDKLTFGTWQCRCISDASRSSATTLCVPSRTDDANVSIIPTEQMGGVAQRGLDVLMEFTETIGTLETRNSVAQAAADAIMQATGCRRVVVVERESDEELSLLAATSEQTPQVSSTLIEQAARQGPVQMLIRPGQQNQAQSIMELGIRSAICVPILVERMPSAFITIDTRDAEGVVPPDAASFCQSIARLVGLAFQRLNSALMAERHRQLNADLDAARRAQELLSPPKQGKHGSVAYQFESIPGRVVAGDLFDIFPLDKNQTAFFLGDVSGKGVGAAMLMAACQSQLRTQLLSGADLAAAIDNVNIDLHQRSETSKFVTLIAGIIDTDKQHIDLIDAGHGLCIHASDTTPPTQIKTSPGFPLGVVSSTKYQTQRLGLDRGFSIVLFSDGAVEQTDDAGNQFGVDGVLGCLDDSSSSDNQIQSLVTQVQNHADGSLADDLTVAKIWVD